MSTEDIPIESFFLPNAALSKLKEAGIYTAHDLLLHAYWRKQRVLLAKYTGVPIDTLNVLIQLLRQTVSKESHALIVKEMKAIKKIPTGIFPVNPEADSDL